MTNIVKLKPEIDYLNTAYWLTEDAAGLRYFLNKAVVCKKLTIKPKKLVALKEKT